MGKGLSTFGAIGLAVAVAAAWAAPAFGLCVEPGQRAKHFELTDLEGAPVALSDYQGKVVLMVLWASWCSGCQEELRFLEEISGRFTDDLVVLAINQETEEPSAESVGALRQAVAESGLGFPVLLDPGLGVWSDYCVSALPTSILVGRDGGVALTQTHFSWASEDTFLAALTEQGVIRP